jgi:hypothetical protein
VKSEDEGAGWRESMHFLKNVWQIKELGAHFSYVWQGKELVGNAGRIREP